MWGTSSPGDKLTGDFGNEPDATSISDRGLFRLLAGNLSPGVFRLLQHNLPLGDLSRCSNKLRLLDHLVGAGEQSRRHLEPSGQCFSEMVSKKGSAAYRCQPLPR